MQLLAVLVMLSLGIPTASFLVLSLFEGFPRIKLRQVAGLVVVAALIFALFAGPGGESMVAVVCVVAPLLIFFGLWRHEFQQLMLRREDEFPDRRDKSRWFLVLTFAAPAGVWLFRSFRKARWPEPATARSRGPQSPWDDERDDALSPEPAAVV